MGPRMAILTAKPPSKPVQARVNMIIPAYAARVNQPVVYPCHILFRQDLEIPYLEIPLGLAFHVLLRDILPLVVEFLALRKTDLHLHEAAL